jgi:DNA-binding winged helix-turn-helix (wHTH) protein/tetratricopeptide (TPR) repeat protein
LLFIFNDIEIDPATREIRRGGVPVESEPKVFDVLLYLVERRERVVGKKELLDAVWERRVVSEAAMTRAIHAARRLIGDSQAIKTFYGRGYRFVGSARSSSDGASASRVSDEPSAQRESGARSSARSALARLDLIGREPELTLATECLEAASAGQRRTLIVTGEAGVGKTALCERIALLSAERGSHAVWGRSSEVPGAPAYWPFTQVLRAIGQVIAPARRHALLEAHPKIRELFAPSGLGPSAISGDAEQARFRLFDSIGQALRSIFATDTFTIIVDDLHCADTPSLLLFHFLVQQLTDAHLLLVAAYRDAEMRSDPSRARWVSDLLRQPGVRTAALHGLDVAQVRLLVEAATGGPADPNAVDHLVEQTAGNPFYLSQIIPLFRPHDGSSDAPARSHSRLPGSVRDAVESHLSALSSETRRVLEAGAVIGREFELVVLTGVTTLDTSAVLRALEPARTAGLVARTGSLAAGFRFAHVIVRDTLYAGLADAARGELHGLVGEAFEELYEGTLDEVASELSHHFTEATGIDSSDKAIRYAVMAGDVALKKLAYEDATREFERAVAALTRTKERDEQLRCDLLLKLASAYTRSGQLDLARKIFSQAADLARRIEEPKRLAMVALDLAPGFFSIETSHFDKYLVERLEEALAVLGDTDPILRARLLSRLSIALYWTDQAGRRTELCAEAGAIADRTGSSEARLHALTAQHASLWSPHNALARLEWSGELISLSERTGDSETLLVSRCLRILDLLEQGDMGSVRDEMARFKKLADAIQQPECIWMADMYENMLALARGEFARVEQFGLRSIELGQRIRHHNAYQTGGVYIGMTRCETSGVEELIPALETNMETYPLASWAGLHTLACLRAGDDERTLKSLKRSLTLLPKQPPNHTWLPAMVGMCEAASHLHAGNEAAILSERLACISTRYVVIGYGIALFGSLNRSLGLLALAEERWTDAVDLLESAVEENLSIELEPYVAHSRRELAKALRQRGGPGDRRRATRSLEQAHATAERLGMTWLLRQARTMA